MSKICNSCGKALAESEICLCNEGVLGGVTNETATETETLENENQNKKVVVLGKTENQDQVQNQVSGSVNISKNTNANVNTDVNANTYANADANVNTDANTNNVKQENIFSSEKAKEVMNDTSNYLKKMFAFSIDFIKKPLTTMKDSAVNHNFKKGLFFIGLQSLLFTIVILIITNKTSSALSFFGIRDKVPYFSIFLKSFIFSVITFLLLPASFFVTSKLFKSESNIKSLITIVGVSSIPLIIATAILVVGIFIAESFVILLFGALSCSVILTYIGLNQIASIDEDKVIYWAVAGFVLFSILLIILSQLINPLEFISLF